ncbi:MAG: hypothetical protein QW051_04220 [Candidatus Aenigmatarchaeota archaeon]
MRSIFIPPVALILILIFGSILVSIGILYYTHVTHLEGDLLRFENQFVEMKLPRNWYGTPMEYNFQSSGKTFSAIIFDPSKIIYIGISVFDETSTETFLNNCRLTDARSVINYEVNMTYYEIRKNRENATLIFIENGTRTVSGFEAEYSVYKILDGYVENDVSKNISYMMLSYFHNQKLVQIAYWGSEEYFDSSLQEIETFISNLRVKT